MPRYFFSTAGDDYPRDDEGLELSGPEEAQAEAIDAAGDMLKQIDGAFWTGQTWQMHVTDETGATVCILSVQGTNCSS